MLIILYLRNKKLFHQFKELLKIRYCAGLVITCLLYISLNYSINTIPYHQSTNNFFAVAAIFAHAKITLFQLRTWRTLFTSFKHACKHLFWPASLGWCNYIKKSSLTLPTPCISESCIKIKINLNFYFQTSLWCLKRFYEGL